VLLRINRIHHYSGYFDVMQLAKSCPPTSHITFLHISLKQRRYLCSRLSPLSRSSFASPQDFIPKTSGQLPNQKLTKLRNFNLIPFQFDVGEILLLLESHALFIVFNESFRIGSLETKCSSFETLIYFSPIRFSLL